VIIHGVPEQVDRAALIHALKALGFEVDRLRRLDITPASVTATLAAVDPDGRQFWHDLEPAVHQVCLSYDVPPEAVSDVGADTHAGVA
jgi:hypothetical protein